METVEEGARVLVVEDDPATLETVKAILATDESQHFEVRGVQNGALGLEQVMTFRPEVVVFDFWMPVTDGRGFLQGLREVVKNRVGTVVMSGTPEVEDWCARVGVSGFVRKPFEGQQLRDAVEAALSDARKPPSSRRQADSGVLRRARAERAVLMVGATELCASLRARLREAGVPVLVAAVPEVSQAIDTLGSIAVDAVLVCSRAPGVSPDLELLVLEAEARKIPVLVAAPAGWAHPSVAKVRRCAPHPASIEEALREVLEA